MLDEFDVDIPEFDRMLEVFATTELPEGRISFDDIPALDPRRLECPRDRLFRRYCLAAMVANSMERGFIPPSKLREYTASIRWATDRYVPFTEPVLRRVMQGIIYLEHDDVVATLVNEGLMAKFFHLYRTLFPQQAPAFYEWVVQNRAMPDQPNGIKKFNYQPTLRSFEYSLHAYRLNAEIRKKMEADYQARIRRDKQIKNNKHAHKYLPMAIMKGNLMAAKVHCEQVFFTSQSWLAEMLQLAEKGPNPDILPLVKAMAARVRGQA